MTETILTLENICCGYGDHTVLKGVSLQLSPGEICCLLGEEGAGKSTLLKAIINQQPNTGVKKCRGADISTLATSRMRSAGIDFLLQGGNVLNSLTVAEHVRLNLSEKGIAGSTNSPNEIYAMFPELVKLKNARGGQLSGGERVQLSLACLYAADAPVWLLDEPSAGLSPAWCSKLVDVLKRAAEKSRKAVLLLEHNHEFAFETAATAMVLRNGALSEKFTRREFLEKNFITAQLYPKDKPIY